jgi:prepilin-type processing-associated H-X9-DG protein
LIRAKRFGVRRGIAALPWLSAIAWIVSADVMARSWYNTSEPGKSRSRATVQEGPVFRLFTAGNVAKGLFALAVALLIVVAIGYTYRERMNARCINHLSQIGAALEKYTVDYDWYPPLSLIPGRLMFLPEAIHPAYIADFSSIDDKSYYYLGYLIFHERSGLAWINEYKQCISRGAIIADRHEIWPDCIPAFEERKKAYREERDRAIARGDFRGKIFPRLGVSSSFFDQSPDVPTPAEECLYARLRQGVERYTLGFFAPELVIGNPVGNDIAKARIPVMIERPELHGNGGHVLYMDGHVEFVPYPGKFPMVPSFVEGLRSLDALENHE